MLAWGNSMPDLISDASLARDGYPTMALTACFASPLFVLLAGGTISLSYGSLTNGHLDLPVSPALRIMYAFSLVNLAKWALLVPLAFRFRLGPRAAAIAFAFYALFQLFYALTEFKEL